MLAAVAHLFFCQWWDGDSQVSSRHLPVQLDILVIFRIKRQLNQKIRSTELRKVICVYPVYYSNIFTQVHFTFIWFCTITQKYTHAHKYINLKIIFYSKHFIIKIICIYHFSISNSLNSHQCLNVAILQIHYTCQSYLNSLYNELTYN